MSGPERFHSQTGQEQTHYDTQNQLFLFGQSTQAASK
jgi:hypothetical protein